MTATTHLRGHPIEWDILATQWIYTDTRQPTASTWEERPCGHCGDHCTPEGHDPCLGTLPGVMNACCGHGEANAAYVQFGDRTTVRGQEALSVIDELRASDKEASK
ncbi:hypothetical protein [Halomonas sp. Mc5H-6]|uniref:hypothetical protein n=1 Tax=Halomonas sp. Mc5H-6 TaxID=2954500 RepID=UPI002097B85B|nr:hypothetical protein [Halomonas sp. Mc5H-6]MCO7246415.1 hypothetical protein [Halomonas sp. Mc5H-6]